MNRRVFTVQISLPNASDGAIVADSKGLAEDNYPEVVQAVEAAFGARRGNRIGSRETIVYRLSPKVDWAKAPSAVDLVIRNLATYGRKRNPENPIVLVYSADFQIFPTVVFDPAGDYVGRAAQAIIEQIRTFELASFLEGTEALFEFGRTAFFDLPSGQFSDYFFRVGNLQSDPDYCQAAFFWTIPHLRNISAVVADTWSISTTAATIAASIETYAGGKRVSWSHLHNYLPISNMNMDQLKLFLTDGLGESGAILFLNSFGSSGRLEKSVLAVKEALKGSRDLEFLSIFADSRGLPSGSPYLCDISTLLTDRNLSGRTNDAIVDAPILAVSSRTYFPDFRQIANRPFTNKFAADKSFFERYAGLGIFSVYRTGRSLGYTSSSSSDTKPRHHAFHVDIDRLFETADFAMSVRSGECHQVTTVVTNGSSSSLNLGRLYSRVAGCQGAEFLIGKNAKFLDVCENVDLSARILLDPSQTVLFSVPTVISGESLGNLQEQLRRILGSERQIRASIVVLIGLLRPDHTDKLRRLSGPYLDRAAGGDSGWVKTVVVESLILPNWQEERCPWHRELQGLQLALDVPELDDGMRLLAHDRIDTLRRAAREGLRGEDVFLVRQGSSRLRFNPGSHWMDLDSVGSGRAVSEADLCCAVASALQRWRIAERKDVFRISTIDSAVLTDHNGFNEARLRASIWRGLRPWERIGAVRSATTANDFATMARRIFISDRGDENYGLLELEAVVSFDRDLKRILSAEFSQPDFQSLGALATSFWRAGSGPAMG